MMRKSKRKVILCGMRKKIVIIADYIIVYIETAAAWKNYKLLDTINEFSRANIQMSSIHKT